MEESKSKEIRSKLEETSLGSVDSNMLEKAMNLHIPELGASFATIALLLEETLLVLLQANVLKESQIKSIFDNVKSNYISRFIEQQTAAKLQPNSELLLEMLDSQMYEVKSTLTRMQHKLFPNTSDSF